MKFTFKGDGASTETTVFGVTFPLGEPVSHTLLTDAQALLLTGNPMFEVSEDGPAPKPTVAVSDPAPKPDAEK